jgi:DNA mismatch endonuclease (patch repair protein)
MSARKKPMTRSENMARVKSKNTNPEVYLRKLLWHEGLRYRINYKDLPGKPDIYLPRNKTAIFVNGCFWHMHEGCKLSTVPKTNYNFWREKLEGNAERDKRNYEKLKDLGINVVVVWGCEIKEMMKSEETERDFVKKIINVITE